MTYFHRTVAFATLAALAMLASCIVVPPPENPPPGGTPGDGQSQPAQPVPEQPGPGDGTSNPGTDPSVDCSAPPARACCKALTPQCQDCARQARDERAAWEQTCGTSTAPPPVDPAQPAIDCNQRPEVMCCMAVTAACQDCARKRDQQLAAWDAQCGPQSQPQPSVDCNRPPDRMCCQAMTENCDECRRIANEERAAWNAQCSGK